jgi:hypothetical protein
MFRALLLVLLRFDLFGTVTMVISMQGLRHLAMRHQFLQLLLHFNRWFEALKSIELSASRPISMILEPCKTV